MGIKLSFFLINLSSKLKWAILISFFNEGIGWSGLIVK